MPITCSGCGYENRLSAAACGSCGERLDARSSCASCGSPNPVGQRFCNECGVPLRGRAGAARTATTSRLAPEAGARPSLPRGETLAQPSFPRRRESIAGVPSHETGPYPPHPPHASGAAQGPLPRSASRPSMLFYAGVALFFGVAAFARLADIGSSPDPMAGPESQVPAAVSSVLDGRAVGLWSEAAGGQPTGFVYALAGWAGVLGDGAASLRSLSALLGLAAVAMFFVYCRALFGPRAALLGAMLLAFSLWHIGYSRLALPVGALVLLQLAASYLLLTAMRSGERPRGFALAGAVFGAAVYTHNAFYVFAVVVSLWWARELLAGERPVAVVWSRFAAFLAAALIVAAPYAWSLAADRDEAGERLGAVWLSNTAGYAAQPGFMEQSRFTVGNIVSTAAALPLRGDDGPARRLLDPATALLAAAGLMAALWRWRSRESFHVWSAAAAAVVVVGLTRDDGMYGRLIVALPAVYAAAGYALDGLIELMRGRVTPAVAFAVAALLLAAAGAYNLLAFSDGPIGHDDSRWARVTLAAATPHALARRRGGRAGTDPAPDVAAPGHATLEVRVRPRSGRDAVSVDAQGRVRVNVAAPAHEGRANAAAVKLIADRLGVATGRVAIVGGLRSRDKLVRVEDAALAAVLARLRSGA